MFKITLLLLTLSLSSFANELNAPSYSMFKQLLKEANMLQTVIANRKITLLAPTNEAFKELTTEEIKELIKNKSDLKELLNYHVIERSLTFYKLTKAHALSSKSGKLIKVTNKNSDILINDAFVLSVDTQRRGPTIVSLDKILNHKGQANYIPQTAKNVDLGKYLGTWYEVGRFDHSFQEGCVSTKAHYQHSWAGIKVLNSCLDENEEIHEAKGLAKLANKEDTSKLKVSFVPFLKYLGVFTGDYLILKMDKSYQNVLVGDYSRKHLWLLSRSPKGNEDVLQEYLEYAATQGYEIENFIVSRPWPEAN